MLARKALLVVIAAVAIPAAAATDPETAPPAPPLPSVGSYSWPVHGPVLRGFEPPTDPYGPGHRGIDIASASGTPVRASSDGVVAFAGSVAGDLHVSIDHPDGVRTSYAFLGSVDVNAGDAIARGEVLGAVGAGHAGTGQSHLHFGARFGGQYIDPMLLLERGSLVGLIHLAPLEDRGSQRVP